MRLRIAWAAGSSSYLSESEVEVGGPAREPFQRRVAQLLAAVRYKLFTIRRVVESQRPTHMRLRVVRHLPAVNHEDQRRTRAGE